LDQRSAPLGPVVGGVAFQSLGTVTLIGSGPLRVVLSNAADGNVIADALRVAPLASIPAILDNGDPGFLQTRTWWQFAGPGPYNNNVAYIQPGDGSAQTTWQFASIAAGTYNLQVTWVPDPSRASNAPYLIYEGNTLLKTVFLDQRPAPVGPVIGG